MLGKEDAALLLDCKSLESETQIIDFDGVSILLINTNVKHKLSDSAYNKRRETCERVANHFRVESLRDIKIEDLLSSKEHLNPDDYQKASYVLEENNRVLAFKEAIDYKNVDEMGKLMYGSHDGLQKKYEVSCEELDFLVDYGRDKAYVLGSRMMGGGFGGCTINLVRTEHVYDFGSSITNAYRDRFNRNCDLISVKLSDGTKQL
ncbi:MAG: galactokinase, partial [Bacteroidota bacterium]